jgi:hypothetical protein
MNLRRPGFVLVLPLLLAGGLAGHWLAYRLVLPGGDERAHALASTGHEYLTHAPQFLALCLALVALAVGGRIVAAARGRRVSAELPRRLALVPPAAFLVQEGLERLLHTGHLSPAYLVEQTTLVGLGLQVAVGIAAVALARALAGAADELGRALAPDPPRLLSPAPLLCLRLAPGRPPRRLALALGRDVRGPPPLL